MLAGLAMLAPFGCHLSPAARNEKTRPGLLELESTTRIASGIGPQEGMLTGIIADETLVG